MICNTRLDTRLKWSAYETVNSKSIVKFNGPCRKRNFFLSNQIFFGSYSLFHSLWFGIIVFQFHAKTLMSHTSCTQKKNDWFVPHTAFYYYQLFNNICNKIAEFCKQTIWIVTMKLSLVLFFFFLKKHGYRSLDVDLFDNRIKIDHFTAYTEAY